MRIPELGAASLKSPLSELPPTKIRELPKTFILEQLELYYRAKPPASLVQSDYSIWECSETGLQFAWPMLPGSREFYEWVSSFAGYYPETRWEYGAVRRVLEEPGLRRSTSLNVFDAGCGTGEFLRQLHFVPAHQRFGLDLNEVSIEVCRQRGFQAYCGTIESALKAGFLRISKFQLITSFHCLEHVDRPIDYVRSLVELTAPGGRIFLSTPLSPMSFEASWFDILNHPPHHLTRWNLRAYERLASILGLRMRSYFPRPGRMKQALMTFRLLRYGPRRSVGKARLCGDLLLNIGALARLYQTQQERSRKNKGITADVILVELTVP